MFNMFSFTDIIGLFKNAAKDNSLTGAEDAQQKKLLELFETRGSVMSLLEPYLIEPTLFVTHNAKTLSGGKYVEAINDQIDYFTSIYCQAFKILTQVHNVRGDIAIKLLKTTGYGLTPVEYGIDTVKKYIRKEIKTTFESGLTEAQKAIEKIRDNSFLTFNGVAREDKDPVVVDETGGSNGKIIDKQNIMEKTIDNVGYHYQIRKFNVSVPTEFETTDKKGTVIQVRTVEIPITIKCNIVVIGIEQLVNALTNKRDSNNLYNRILEWRSGGISFLDLLVPLDLIQQYSESKKKDKDDIINILNSREFTSYAETIVNGKSGKYQLPVGFERFYNLFCMTEQDFRTLEIPIAGKLDKPVMREKLFNKLNAQQIMVLDTELETAKLYLQKFPEPSIISFSKLGKRKGGGKETDLTDLFQALLDKRSSSSVPVF